MAQIQKQTYNTKSKTTGFFGACFGFSVDKKSPEKVVSGKHEKSRSFSWSKFRMKKLFTSKTVPVDASVSDKTKVFKKEARPSKPKSEKLFSKRQNPDTGPRPLPVNQIPPNNSDQDITQKSHMTKYGPEQIALGNRDSAWNETRQKGNRKSEGKKPGRSHPGSPENKFNSGPITSIMSHSGSFPARNRQKRGRNISITTQLPAKSHREKDAGGFGRLDPIVGMSIVMVTLIILLMWGRLCAVLCTSAWFYFIARFRFSIEQNGVVKSDDSSSQKEDMNSEMYKKKVVLEGFLERNRRNSTVGFL